MQSIPDSRRRANHSGPESLFALMVEKARYRDRLYFCSDATAARELGVSRRTIIRWRQRLEGDGRIVRKGRHRIGACKATVVYGFPRGERRLRDGCVTQRSSIRGGKPSRTVRFAHGSGRIRIWTVKDSPDRLPGFEVEVVQPRGVTAQDVVGAVADCFAGHGVPLATRYKGIVARHARDLLRDGFDAATVTMAAVIACRRSEPQHMTFIASDLAIARAGLRITRREYEKQLQDEAELGWTL